MPTFVENAAMVLEQMEKAARKLIALGLSPPQFVILMELSRGSRIMTELAASCSFTSAAATGATDRLERQGLVARTHDREDRRRVIVNLTKKGRDKIDSVSKD